MIEGNMLEIFFQSLEEKASLFFSNVDFFSWSFFWVIFFFFFSYILFDFFQNSFEKKLQQDKKIKSIKKISDRKYTDTAIKFFVFMGSMVFFFSFFMYTNFQKGQFFLADEKIKSLFFLEIFLLYIFSFFLYLFFITDLKYRMIPNKWNYILMFLSVSVSALFLSLTNQNVLTDFWGFFVQAFSISFPFFLLYYYSNARYIGGADWKVIFSLSLILGSFYLSYIFVMISFVLGACIASVLYLLDFFGVKDASRELPLVPFLIIGFLVTFLMKVGM